MASQKRFKEEGSHMFSELRKVVLQLECQRAIGITTYQVELPVAPPLVHALCGSGKRFSPACGGFCAARDTGFFASFTQQATLPPFHTDKLGRGCSLQHFRTPQFHNGGESLPCTSTNPGRLGQSQAGVFLAAFSPAYTKRYKFEVLLPPLPQHN